MDKNKNIELLAPVGCKESAIAAINAGCDAIYLGGKNFNARNNAQNFTENELKEIIDYSHERGVKVNLTLNILYKENEIQDVLDFVSKAYAFGIDAIIIQDIGIFNIIKTNFKKVFLHASTQMTIHNLEGALFLQDLGFKRIVLSRELSLEEIKNITQNTTIEIEVFVHGALCFCYSGRCFMSSFIGERSGNRGRCAQPCRKVYQLIKDEHILAKSYLLSPKDINTLPIIDRLIDAGIHTFKIEGRMKNPEYVALVNSNYKKYIEKAKKGKFDTIDPLDNEELLQIFNRGGSFSLGYYFDWAGNKMISKTPKNTGTLIGKVKSYDKKTKICNITLSKPLTPGDGIEIWTKSLPHSGTSISKKASASDTIRLTIAGDINKGDLVFKTFDKNLYDKLKKAYQKDTKKREVKASIYACLNKPLNICLSIGDVSVSVFGEIATKAINNCVSQNKFIEQLSKTGNSPFYFTFENILIDSDIFVPISSINALRRNAIEALLEKIRKSFEREYIDVKYIPKIETKNKTYLTALVQNKAQFEACLDKNIKRIYIELSKENIEHIEFFIYNAKKYNTEVFVALHHILRKVSYKSFYEMLDKLENSKIDGYLLRNYIKLKTTKKIALDYTFNVFNNASIEALLKFANTVTLSLELSLKEIYALSSQNTEAIIYGKIPLMTTHQCPIGLFADGKESGMFCKMQHKADNYYLKDEKGAIFPLKADCFNCTTTILNNNPIFILNKLSAFKKIKTQYLRLNFLDENSILIKDIIKAHVDALHNSNFDLNNTSLKNFNYTNGYFFRGIL